MNTFSDHEIRLLNDWQRDFPLVDRPFASIAQSTDSSHDETITAYTKLAEKGVISRIGAVVTTGALGASTLAAIAVPEDQLENIAEKVSTHRGVNHNYERTHRYNLWFVVTAQDQSELDAVLLNIESQTGLKVMSLPMLESYHIDLGFDLKGKPESLAPKHGNNPSLTEPVTCPVDRQLLWALESGLPFTDQPYDAISKTLNIPVENILTRITRLLETGAIKRFGVVVRHHELGYKSNAMVVWNIPDNQIKDAVSTLTEAQYVTLCYRRPRLLPEWPYNVFSMIHGQDRDQVLDQIDSLARQKALSNIDHEILFSTRRFKQTGARYSPVKDVKEVA
jgi:siroheme decarboxylase